MLVPRLPPPGRERHAPHPHLLVLEQNFIADRPKTFPGLRHVCHSASTVPKTRRKAGLCARSCYRLHEFCRAATCSSEVTSEPAPGRIVPWRLCVFLLGTSIRIC